MQITGKDCGTDTTLHPPTTSYRLLSNNKCYFIYDPIFPTSQSLPGTLVTHSIWELPTVKLSSICAGLLASIINMLLL